MVSAFNAAEDDGEEPKFQKVAVNSRYDGKKAAGVETKGRKEIGVRQLL